MNQRFPDATPEEITNAHVCIVCREDMAAAKRLPCGRIFSSSFTYLFIITILFVMFYL